MLFAFIKRTSFYLEYLKKIIYNLRLNSVMFAWDVCSLAIVLHISAKLFSGTLSRFFSFLILIFVRVAFLLSSSDRRALCDFLLCFSLPCCGSYVTEYKVFMKWLSFPEHSQQWLTQHEECIAKYHDEMCAKL